MKWVRCGSDLKGCAMCTCYGDVDGPPVCHHDAVDYQSCQDQRAS